MKAPSLSPAAAGAFFIDHGEKVVVAIFGGIALLMIWWGVSAAQLQSVDRARTPDALENLARQAAGNIEASPNVPHEKVPRTRPLAPRVDPWRPQAVKLADAPARSLVFDRPMYAELTKRTKPDVFPIEALRAVAGVAVFVDPNADARGTAARPRQPVAPPPPPPPPTGRTRPGRPGRGPEQPEDTGLGFHSGMGPITADVPPDEQVGPGKIAPFVVVTGLIPAAKQQEEFANRFANVSFRDPRRDNPRWTAYIVERTRVVPGAEPRWERRRLVNVQNLADNPGGMSATAAALPGGPLLHQEKLPPGFFLQPGEAEIEYAAALPARVDRPWGGESIHPWFVPEIRELLEKGTDQPEEDEAQPVVKLADLVNAPGKYLGRTFRLSDVVLETDSKVQKAARLHRFGIRSADGSVAVDMGVIGEVDKLVFATSDGYGGRLAFDLTKPRACNLLVRVDPVGKTPVARLLEIDFLDDNGEVVDTRKDPAPEAVQLADDPRVAGGGMMPQHQGQGAAIQLAKNRLFRFVDLEVVPGAEYRYRVRFALRNPNVGLAPQHVVDMGITRGDFLLADYSPETATVRVPDTTRILARTIPREAARKLKVRGENVEVIVMAPSDENGNYAIRSVITPPGGAANVDLSLNKASDVRHFGQPVKTDRLLIDFRGVQEERAAAKNQPPAEPLEMLFLRPDGEFDIVTAADSELFVRKYRSTLFRPGEDLPDDGKPPKPPR